MLWLDNSKWGYLTYGNVVVIAPFDVDNREVSIVATKKLANSLR